MCSLFSKYEYVQEKNKQLMNCLCIQFTWVWSELTFRNEVAYDLQYHAVRMKMHVINSKCRLKVGYSCYYSVQTLLYSRLLSRNLKTKIHKTIILRVVLYGCETLSLRLGRKCVLRVFENRILSLIFEPKRDENGESRRVQMRSFTVFTVHLMHPARLNLGVFDSQVM